MKPLDLTKVSDEDLFYMLREQVNLSRHKGGHQPAKTRAIAAEAQRRGWNLRRPIKPSP